MKPLLASFIALAALAAGLQAQSKVKSVTSADNAPAVNLGFDAKKVAAGLSFAVSGDVTTKYVFRGVERQHLSLQPAVLVRHTAGLYASAFANLPWAHISETEYDVNLGYSKSFGRLNLDGGAVAYFVSDIPGRDWSQEFYLGASYYFPCKIGVRYYAYYDTRVESLTHELALGYAIPLNPAWSNVPASIQISFYIGHSDARDFSPDAAGGHIRQSNAYYGASVSLPIRLTNKLSAEIGVRYGQTRNYFEQGAQDANFWGFASIGYDF
ncbi:MAG: hypothetical protein LBR12_02695 [Opitutaceae bacterium]|jgi:hypothetical protein|nr:hypothetical protein [Opitutaceae bacterium]